MSLLIVGTVAFDGIETPFGKVNKILGRSATYIGISSSYFNKSANLISVVGGDFEKENITLLENHNINCEGLEIIKNEKTFFWSGKYHKNMNFRDTIETQLNVLEKDYQKLKKDLVDSGEDKRVIYAMVTNFQQRTALLQNVLETIENIQQLKEQDNESNIL